MKMGAQLASGDIGMNFHLLPKIVCASSKSSGDTAYLRRFARASTAHISDKYKYIMSMRGSRGVGSGGTTRP